MKLRQFKANRLSIFLGGAKEMFGRLSFYIQIGTISMVAVNFWDTDIMKHFRADNLWLSFGLFVAVVVIGGLALAVLEYTFIMPGSYAFSTRQFVEHENEMMVDIKKMQEEQKKQGAKLTEMYDKVIGGKEDVK